MSIELNLRYQKKDMFGSQIFIVSSKYDEEKESYEKLLAIETKLKEQGLDTFLPVYSNTDIEYATIRFKFLNSPVKLTERDLYTVKFVVKQLKKNNKDYLNCVVNTIKLLKKEKPVDTGITLDLGI